MQSKAICRPTVALFAACLAFLSACGGGGGAAGSTDTTTPGTPSTPATSVVLSGVAAVGAPLSGATVRIVDGAGAAVGLLDSAGKAATGGTTNLIDGTFRLTLGSTLPKAPLLIEASGFDAAGNPVVLHSMVATSANNMVANITPLTDAVVAHVLGADPKTVFINAATNADTIALLANSANVTKASDQVKAIVTKNFTDAKLTTVKTLDFFQDATFVANKTAVDAVLESVKIQIAHDSTGKDLLLFSNSLNAAGPAEVKVDLATVKAELAKAASGNIATAIVSTLKATTSPTTTLTTLNLIDDLATATNKLIAQKATANAFAAVSSAAPAPPSPAPVAGTTSPYFYNGRSLTAFRAKLASYATNNYQLGKLQVTGCADAVVTKVCTYVGVSAVVTDSTGKFIESFSDTVIYNKATVPTWQFAGNGRTTRLDVTPVALARLGFDGTLAATDLPNPSVGVQVAIVAQDAAGAKSIGSGIVQLPNGHSVPFAYCGGAYLCVAADNAAPVATGELKDTLLQQPATGWIGTLDGVVGAKYLITYTPSAARSTAQTATVFLAADVPNSVPASTVQVLDDVSAAKPLTTAAIDAGLALSWAKWAAVNPDMKVFMVRILVTSATDLPVVSDVAIPSPATTSVTATAAVLPAGFVPATYQVWVGTQDSLGRRYYSQYSTAP